jgi:Protein of unknown function (DUF3618)
VGTQAEELSTTPADIEATRADLSRNIDDLTEKVSPQRVMQRQKQAAKGRLASVKDKVMGTASARDSATGAGASVGESAGQAAGSVGGAAQGAMSSIQTRTDGNPLAVGLMAFGAGMVISALIPASEKEEVAAQRMVDQAKDSGLVEEGSTAAQQVAESLRDAANDAAQEVKSTAQDSARTIKDESQWSARNVKEEASPGS